MKKLTIPAAVASLALVLAACGGSAKSGSPTAAKVLVNSSGMALYTPDGETAHNIRCTGACTSVWQPLRPGAATLTGSSVITRPDGTKQLAVNGRPLYTFVQDSPGAVTGNGAKDAFGARQFSWHAVQPGGKAAAPAAPASNSGGYGASNGGY